MLHTFTPEVYSKNPTRNANLNTLLQNAKEKNRWVQQTTREELAFFTVIFPSNRLLAEKRKRIPPSALPPLLPAAVFYLSVVSHPIFMNWKVGGNPSNNLVGSNLQCSTTVVYVNSLISRNIDDEITGCSLNFDYILLGEV